MTRRPMHPISEPGVYVAPKTRWDKLRDDIDMAETLLACGLIFAVVLPFVVVCDLITGINALRDKVK